jgi:hypothetical protein
MDAPNEDNALVTLPGDVLNNIGSFLTPGDRARLRVSRGLSNQFSRKTRRIFRITERRILKYPRFPAAEIINIREFGFFSNSLGYINQEDILKLMNCSLNSSSISKVDDFRTQIRPQIIWNSLPEAWKNEIQYDHFAHLIYFSGIYEEDQLTNFFQKSLWKREELYNEIMNREDKTLVKSTYLLDHKGLLDAHRFPSNALYFEAIDVWSRLGINIMYDKRITERESYDEIFKIFNIRLTVEILIENV